MSRLKYIISGQYKSSQINRKSLKDTDSFIDAIARESTFRKIVEIDGNIVIFGVEGPLILPHGTFWYVCAEVKNGRWGKHHILISPNLEDILKRDSAFIRLDSGCLSGVLGDITCDCLEQLRLAQEIVLKKGGIIIHIPDQDGRGWQEYKMAHQRILQETNLDTIAVANKFWGRKNIDIRTFDESALILKALGFQRGYKFDLGTKNPKKIKALTKAGFKVLSYPITVTTALHSLTRNLKAKDKFFKDYAKEKYYARNKER